MADAGRGLCSKLTACTVSRAAVKCATFQAGCLLSACWSSADVGIGNEGIFTILLPTWCPSWMIVTRSSGALGTDWLVAHHSMYGACNTLSTLSLPKGRHNWLLLSQCHIVRLHYCCHCTVQQFMCCICGLPPSWACLLYQRQCYVTTAQNPSCLLNGTHLRDVCNLPGASG